MSNDSAIGDEGVAKSVEHDDELEEFSVPLDRGMRRVEEAERSRFRRSDADALQDRLEDFDAVRTRGEVESRAARLGGRSPN